MDVVHGAQLPYVSSILSHRPGGISFKMLFEGSEDDRPNNYQVALVAQKDFYSPVHKHNFDQIRYAWKGDFSIGPGMTIKQGELCYHPEGVHYGPQTDDASERVLLLLQCGGASGQGYIGHRRLRAANEALEKTGTFDGGKYRPAAGGNPVDGYQALWESVNAGRALEYPKPRYRSPILLTPDNFAWRSAESGAGASTKLLGVFSERGMRAQQVRLAAGGSLPVAAEDATQFLVVREGAGAADGEPLQVESVVRLRAGTGVQLRSDEGMVLLHYVLPMIRPEDA